MEEKVKMEIKNESEFQTIIQNDYVLIDFFATWCGPCKMLSPILENVASTRDNIKIAKVDVDKFTDLARKYGVMSIPTLILFKNGQVVDTKVGFVAEPLLNESINNNR